MPAFDDKVDAAALQPAAEAVRTTAYLGVPIAMLDAEQAAAAIAARPFGARFAYVVTPNAAHFTRLVRLKDARFRLAYDHAWLRLLDGQTPRRLARLLFGLDLPHAAGSDVTALLFERHIAPTDSITVIGGGEAMRERLMAKFGLTNVALHDPPMGFIHDAGQVEACIAFVLAHPARYVFLVVGAPQSEYLACLVHQRGVAVGTGLCVGSSLNFTAGLVTRAPMFYRRYGLEWAYRLMLNPFGHARRVFVDSLPVVGIALQARMNPAAFGMGGKDDKDPG